MTATAAPDGRLLQTDETAFRVMVESLDEVILVVDGSTRILYTSPALSRLVGFSSEELQGRVGLEFVHPEDLPLVGEKLAAVLSTPAERVQAEYRFRHKDGSWRRLHSTATLLPPDAGAGGPPLLMVVSSDVTARAAAEQTQRLLETFIASSEDAIVMVTTEGRITSWNPKAEQLFGWPAEEVVGTLATSMIPPETLPVVMENVARVLQGHVLTNVEEERLTRDGRRIPLSMTVFPLRSPHGEILGIGTIARDLRDRRLAAQVIEAQATTRRHMRRVLQAVARRSRVAPQALRELGHELADEVAADSMEAFTYAFSAAGLGRLRVREQAEGRFVLEGRDLLELAEGATQPTCHLALGFLEASAGALDGGKGLGTEMECQSMGDARCVFVVRSQARRAR